jgi:hypothetical protein
LLTCVVGLLLFLLLPALTVFAKRICAATDRGGAQQGTSSQ